MDASWLNTSFLNKVKISKETELEGDFVDFVRIVDIFASEYGIGGCRSLEEFAKTVDETDPALIGGLLHAIERRYRAEAGENVSDKPRDGHTAPAPRTSPRSTSSTSNRRYDRSKTVSNGQAMAAFLKTWGADSAKVDEAIKQIREGKIKPSTEDFDITPEDLVDPSFNLQSMLKKMRNSREKSANFRVSLETLHERLKNGR